MAMNPTVLAAQLKAQLSTSSDPVLKAAVDGYFDILANELVTFLQNNAVITTVTVSGSTQNNSAPLQ